MDLKEELEELHGYFRETTVGQMKIREQRQNIGLDKRRDFRKK